MGICVRTSVCFHEAIVYRIAFCSFDAKSRERKSLIFLRLSLIFTALRDEYLDSFSASFPWNSNIPWSFLFPQRKRGPLTIMKGVRGPGLWAELRRLEFMRNLLSFGPDLSFEYKLRLKDVIVLYLYFFSLSMHATFNTFTFHHYYLFFTFE